jgi:putative DNA primase/helicase
MSYSITNAPRILKQVEAFKEYFAEKTGSERYGDQYGTAMAGEWILMNEHIPTKEEIEKALEVDSGIWDIIEDRDATTSQGDFLLFLSQLIIPVVDLDGRRYERSFVELVKIISGRDAEVGVGFEKACARSLNHRGIHYDNGVIIFSKNNENLMKMFNTNPQYQDYITLLKRINGSEEKRKRIGGERLSCVAVPEKAILDLDWVNKEWENKQKLMEY